MDRLSSISVERALLVIVIHLSMNICHCSDNINRQIGVVKSRVWLLDKYRYNLVTESKYTFLLLNK
jgi:hypothetical protein